MPYTLSAPSGKALPRLSNAQITFTRWLLCLNAIPTPGKEQGPETTVGTSACAGQSLIQNPTSACDGIPLHQPIPSNPPQKNLSSLPHKRRACHEGTAASKACVVLTPTTPHGWMNATATWPAPAGYSAVFFPLFFFFSFFSFSRRFVTLFFPWAEVRECRCQTRPPAPWPRG